MKNFCVIHILLFILLMLAYQCTSAQDHVVTTKGDTIQGEVKPISYGPEKKVQVTTGDKKKNVFSIFQTRAYSYKGETYHPVKSAAGYVFMQLIKPGYLSLYAYQLQGQVSYDGLYLTKKDGSALEVPNLTFKKIMVKYLSDCPEVAARIDNGDLNKRSMHTIVDEYNACIQARTTENENVSASQAESLKKISAWDVLEEKVRSKPDFEGKSDALDMIADIKRKIKREEKVPNFLLEGLKSSLSKAEVTTEIQNAVNELNN